ncbi:phospho phosphatase protein [Rutstroemia sp. NJR-2017a BBW]|nr:phospho phosphatase protein [Rutstroemia sp. NJR-2017a BBW]
MAPLGGDKKVQPSSASGGIPNPTPQYLTNSTEIPRMAANPRHLLVVIDLNGTLLYRPNRKLPTKFTPRPHAQKFLEYCVDTFTVVIWSSARQENVEPMCQTILTPRLRQKVVAIWGRESFNLSPSDYNQRVQCYKRLTTLWMNTGIAASHPDFARGGRWDQTNTVLIDDSSEKARSEPFNLVEIPEFFGDHREVGDILPQVHDYLNFLSLHENVSATIRNQPFRARAGNPHEAVGLDLPIQNPVIRSSAIQ